MNNRHNRRKEEILDTALTVWGSIPVEKRSLGILADACEITKPGLYRYFSNKQAIIDALMDRLYRATAENKIELTTMASQTPLPWEEIIDSSFTFFFHNWRYIKMGIQEGIFADRGDRFMIPGFYKALGDKSGISGRTWLWVFNVIVATMWSKRRDPDLLKIGFRKKLIDRILYGFQGRTVDWNEVFDRVEARSGDISGDPNETDRIGASIFELICEKGMANFSLSEVADQLGMTKSSLYNYFSSKEEMRNTVFSELRDRYILGREEFLGRFDDLPAKLYAHLIYLSWFVVKNPVVIVLITEMQSRRNFKEKDIWRTDDIQREVFADAAADGLFKEGFLDPLEMMHALTFTFGMDILNGMDISEPNTRARRIFSYFAWGLRTEMQSTKPDTIRIAEVQ